MLRFRRRYSQNCGLEAGPQARDRRAKPTRPGASTECATTGRQVKGRSEEHTSELQSLMRISYAVLCVTKKNIRKSSLRLFIKSNTKHVMVSHHHPLLTIH